MLIDTRSAVTHGYRLTYRLIGIPCRRGISYSLSVKIESEDGADEAAVHDIARSRADADRLFHAVADGLVTPCTLADVLEDLL